MSVDWGNPIRDGGVLPPSSRLLAVAALIALVSIAMSMATAQPVADAGDDKLDYTSKPVLLAGIGTTEHSLPIVLYEWDFEGDGIWDWNSTVSGTTTHVYTEEAEYNATFRVTQYNASSEEPIQTAVDVVKVTIRSGKPIGKITSSTRAQVDMDFELVSNFYDPDGGQLTYTWSIGDGTSSTEDVFEHSFKEVGSYNITLTVEDDEGERAEDQLILQVVKELEEEGEWPSTTTLIGIVVVLVLLLAVAVFAFASIRRHGAKKEEAPPPPEEPESPIIEEPSLEEERVEPLSARTRPRVVSPTRLAAEEMEEEGPPAKVPAAPERAPCPECGTTLGEDGACPFCEANESIDAIERKVIDLKGEGFILANVEDRIEAAKTALHVKNFEEVGTALEEAREAIAEAVRDHEHCTMLMKLVDELIKEAKDRDLDVTKAANLLKLSRSFLKSGKYPKAIQYGEKSRDFLIEILEPFDLDRYFCEHCRAEVALEDDECPVCNQPIESGLIKRIKRELVELKEHFETLAKDNAHLEAIASQLEKAKEHVESRSAAAAREAINKAREILEGSDPTGEAAMDGDHGSPVEDSPEEGAGPEARDPEGPDEAGSVDSGASGEWVPMPGDGAPGEGGDKGPEG